MSSISKLPFKRVVCSEAISLAYLLASQGAAFTSFKLTAFVLNAKLNKKKNKENSQNKRKSLIKVNE